MLALGVFLGLVCGRLWWVLELGSHFPLYYGAIALVVTLVCLCGRRWKLAGFAFFILLVNAWLLVPFYFGANSTSDNATTITACSTNVYTANDNHQELLNLIKQEQPDFVLCLEVDQKWMDSLAELDEDYPTSISRPRQDNFGIAFYSKLPAERLEIIELGTAEVPSVLALLSSDEGLINVVGTHPLPPTSPENARLRNKQLAAAAELAASLDGPVVLLGDLNITPWSPYFRDLLREGKLENSMRGFGIQPTWLGIPIDHFLQSEEVQIVDRRTGPHIGSDHLPILVDFVVVE